MALKTIVDSFQDYANNPNVIISRCDLPENLKANECPESFISNPKSDSEPTGMKTLVCHSLVIS